MKDRRKTRLANFHSDIKEKVEYLINLNDAYRMMMENTGVQQKDGIGTKMMKILIGVSVLKRVLVTI